MYSSGLPRTSTVVGCDEMLRGLVRQSEAVGE